MDFLFTILFNLIINFNLKNKNIKNIRKLNIHCQNTKKYRFDYYQNNQFKKIRKPLIIFFNSFIILSIFDVFLCKFIKSLLLFFIIMDIREKIDVSIRLEIFIIIGFSIPKNTEIIGIKYF